MPATGVGLHVGVVLIQQQLGQGAKVESVTINTAHCASLSHCVLQQSQPLQGLEAPGTLSEQGTSVRGSAKYVPERRWSEAKAN